MWIVGRFSLLLLTLLGAQAWYTCDQLEFCRKIRNADDGSSPFVLNANHFNVGRSKLVAEVINQEDNSSLKLTLTALANSTFRLFIDDPARPRHTFPEALDGTPEEIHFDSFELTGAYAYARAGPNAVQIYMDPFNIQVYSYNKSVMTINSKKRMVFGSGESSAIAMDVSFKGSRLYGIPEHAESLALKTTGPGGLDPYRLFNVDYAGYKVDSRESLYGSVPVLYAHGTQWSSGVFWLNSGQTFVDTRNGEGVVDAYFISESGALDLFFFTGNTLEASVKQYAKLTGTAPLPQYFALGFHQSRYSYMSQEEVTSVVSKFDETGFPLDVMWLDIDYTDNIKYFTWNPKTFSDPIGMQKTLNSTGRKLVVIIDPHYKVEPGYFLYDQALAGGYFVKNLDGSVYEGQCWPGLSSYIDFTNPEAREWYSTLYKLENFSGTTLNTWIWNDMNEPAVFQSEENTMPLNTVVHHGGWLHRDVHNVFGFMQTKGTYEGLLARSNNHLRPFVLTRSHFAGSQRYAAMWTGDNVADWNYLRISVPMCLTEALAGISFCGADVGGFLNNVEDELFQRWYQLGAWLPFFRSHSTVGTNRREPYVYPKEIQARFKSALQQRYFHLPYWYTLWWEHTRTGAPVIRPLAYHYLDKTNFDIDDEWLVGSDILVSPIMNKGATQIELYLPEGTWYSADDKNMYNGSQCITLPVDMDTVPVFYRGGSIIPRKDTARPSSVHTHADPYNLYIFLADEKATGSLYVDDSESFNYKKKEYLYLSLEYKDGELSVSKIDEDADYGGNAKIGNVYLYGQSKNINKAVLMAQETKLDLAVGYNNENGQLSVSGLNTDLRKPFSIRFLAE